MDEPVEPFYRFRYVDKQAFRFNPRTDDDGNVIPDSKRFSTVVSQMVNRRLTYPELTGKEGETEAYPRPLEAGSETGGLNIFVRLWFRGFGFSSVRALYWRSRFTISA